MIEQTFRQLWESDLVRIMMIPFGFGFLAGWFGHYNWQWFTQRERKHKDRR